MPGNFGKVRLFLKDRGLRSLDFGSLCAVYVTHGTMLRTVNPSNPR
jgi:hypothetical protein